LNSSGLATKRKDQQIGLHEIKKLLHNKKWFLNLRGYPQNMRESSSYTSDKGLITKIYRELKKLNSPKVNGPLKKWASKLNREFSKEKVQITNRKKKYHPWA
jgi:hypothetical protein